MNTNAANNKRKRPRWLDPVAATVWSEGGQGIRKSAHQAPDGGEKKAETNEAPAPPTERGQSGDRSMARG